MIKKIKSFINLLEWKLKVFKTQRIYPDAGYYTTMVLAAGATMNEIDEWVREDMNDVEPATIDELREEYCEIEVSYWEP